MFKLKTPCTNCPFKKGQGELFKLGRMRIMEIVTAPAFQCHKTVDYSESENGRPGNKPQQCAGLIGMLLREGKPNEIMSLAILTRHLNPSAVDQEACYASIEEAIREHSHEIRNA